LICLATISIKTKYRQIQISRSVSTCKLSETMNILILESNPQDVDQVKTFLNQIQLMYPIEIVGCLSTVEEARNWFYTHHFPDLILANTHLPDGCTTDLFEEIQIGLSVPIIFITEHSDNVLQAFRYNVIDYILKPFQLIDLRNAFRKLLQLLDLKNTTPFSVLSKLYKDRFLVRFGNKMITQMVSEIAYFYADDKTIFMVNMEGQKSIVDYNLAELEKMLDPQLFFRLNRKYIINISSIKEIRVQSCSQMRVMLHPMQKVSVSRARVSDFKAWAGA